MVKVEVQVLNEAVHAWVQSYGYRGEVAQQIQKEIVVAAFKTMIKNINKRG
jgi:hypothetical protein